MKKYKVGMYGGKFMPMHVGHLHCLETASKLCDKVFLILFFGGNQEDEIIAKDDREFLLVSARMAQTLKAAAMFDNVTPLFIDVSKCRNPDGSENWDAETPLVLEACGKFDAVFGSEPSYAPYFERAYPWADYVMVDNAREAVPISATKIREMNSMEEMSKWIV